MKILTLVTGIFLFLTASAHAAITFTCGGVDDTATMQNAITLAVATGDEWTPPPNGDCRVKSTLVIVGGFRARGVGYQGDSGGGFAGHGITQTSGFLGSVVLLDHAGDGFVATTDRSVQFRNMQVTYLSSSTGIGIKIQALPGVGHANTQSLIQNVMVTGGAIGIWLENCLHYHVSNNHIDYQTNYGMVVNSPNWPNYQQAFINYNVFWGAGNAGYQSYLLVQFGGDLLIEGNKGSGGGPNTNGFAFFGAASGEQTMEPMVVVGNSLEGPQNCITFNTGNVDFFAGNVLVAANQLWGGGRALLVNGFGSANYLLSFLFNSNHISVNGGAGKVAVEVDGIDTASFVGNIFNLNFGGSASTGFVLGPHTTGINVQSNTYGAGYSTKVYNLGTGNTIGGGSL